MLLLMLLLLLLMMLKLLLLLLILLLLLLLLKRGKLQRLWNLMVLRFRISVLLPLLRADDNSSFNKHRAFSQSVSRIKSVNLW
jgi:hypothetical protein